MGTTVKRGWRWSGPNAALSTYVNGTEVEKKIATATKSLVPALNKSTVTVKTSGAGYTITAAEFINGFISDTSATGAIAATLPLVTDVIAVVGSDANTSFYFTYSNPGNQTVTVTTNTGWTLVGTMTIATLNCKTFLCVINSATTATLYSMGTAVV